MKKIAVFLLLIAFLFLGAVGFGQDKKVPPETKAKTVSRYDAAHVTTVFGGPDSLEDSRGTHIVCRVTVGHDDGSVYEQILSNQIVDLKNDMQVAGALYSAYNACRDRVIEISMDYRRYRRVMGEDVIKVK